MVYFLCLLECIATNFLSFTVKDLSRIRFDSVYINDLLWNWSFQQIGWLICNFNKKFKWNVVPSIPQFPLYDINFAAIIDHLDFEFVNRIFKFSECREWFIVFDIAICASGIYRQSVYFFFLDTSHYLNDFYYSLVLKKWWHCWNLLWTPWYLSHVCFYNVHCF